MNLKTTVTLLALIVLGGAGWLGVWLFSGGSVHSETLTTLQNNFSPEAITRIDIKQGDRQIVLEKGADGWTLPGKWPVRKPEVEQLVTTLSTLHSRFAPMPAASDDDLKKLGLAGANVLTVHVKAGGQDYKLTFGEEPGQASRFSRPTFLRLGESSEALRVAPGLIAVFDHPQEYYMQRRLFPVERIAKEGGERNEFVEQLSAKAISAKGGSDAYTAVKAGSDWELREPVRDRVDPDKIKSILTGLPDIWVEKFVEPDKKTLDDFGLKDPAQVLKVMQPGGDVITLLIGKTSDKRSRIVQKGPPPSPFNPKPQIDIIEEEFKFAKLQENDQIFEIKADRLKDIVVAANTLRDPRLARFKTEDVKKLVIDDAGRTLSFAKEDGNWKLFKGDKAEFDVERSKVEDILDKLSNLRADGKEIADKADAKEHGLEKPVTVKVTVEETKEKAKDKEKEKTTKEFTFLLGKQEGGEKGKLFVQVAGWDRVNAVEGDLLKLAHRPALAYRNRRVLNFSAFDAARVDVERTGEKYALEHQGGNWRLANPVQADLDLGKADGLPRELSQLEAVEFITSEPKAEDLDKVYGLAKPSATLKVAFTDKKKAEQTLQVGSKRDGKDEYYARLAGDPAVFAIKKDAFETLTRDSLSLRRADLWKLDADDIAELRVRGTGKAEEFSLARDGDAWKVTGPFTAPVAAERVKPLTEELARLKAEKFVAHAATDLAAYGLDNPYLRVTIKPQARKDKDNEKDKEKDEVKERVLLVGKLVEKDAKDKDVKDKDAKDKGKDKDAKEKEGKDKDAKARYARLGDSEAVFVLSEKALAAVDHGPLDLLDRKLAAIPVAGIKSIRTTTGKDTFSLTREGDVWKVERAGGPPFTADKDLADDAAQFWLILVAQKLVDYGDKVDLAKYGLDKPAATIVVTASEKTDKDKPEKAVERKLLIGSEVKDIKGARYARLEGNPAVAVLDAAVVADLERTPLDFVSRAMLNLSPAKVLGLTRKQGADTLQLVKKDEQWRIAMPADQPADDVILRGLAGDLARLRAKKVAAYPAKDLKPFGLDAPAAVVTLRVEKDKDKTDDHVLEIGKLVEEKGSDRYARLEKSDTVVILPGRLAEQLVAPPLQYRDRLLAKVPAIGKLVLERGTRKATFVDKDGQWKMTEPIDADAERLELEDFVKALAELRADKLVAEKAGDRAPYGLDRPQAQWQLFAPDGKPAQTLLIGSKEKDGQRVYAKLGGSDLVVLLDDRLASQALAEYRARKVWPSLDSFQVEKLFYAYEKAGFTLEKKADDWQVVGKSDLKVKADLVRDTLDALSRLKAERWVVDKDADTKLFGLDPPHLTLTVEAGTSKRVLKVGRQEGGSTRYYATVAGENGGAVFLLSEADARALVRTLEAFAPPKA